MQVLKKRKRILPFLAVLAGVLLLLLAVLAFVPLKSLENKASADGLDDEGYLGTYEVNVEFVGYNPSDSFTLSFSNAENAVQPISGYEVERGFNFSKILEGYNFYNNNNYDKYSEIYVAITFIDKLFDSNTLDLFLSNSNAIISAQAFTKENQLLSVSFEDFIVPMSIRNVSKVYLSSDGYYAPARVAKSFVFRMSTRFFVDAKDLYLSRNDRYCFFVYPKTAFVDYNVAYNQGYNGGYEYGYESGFNEGHENGKKFYFNQGYSKGLNESNKFSGLLGAMFDVPVQTFFGMLNFEILGINLADFVTAFFTISLIIFLIRKFF